MILLNGKETAAAVKKEIAAKVAEMVSRGERPPHLVAVLVGDNGASKTYVDIPRNYIRGGAACPDSQTQ